MQVAYVCADPGVPVFGAKGCSIHVQEGVRALRKLGAEATIFTPRPGGAPPPDLADVPVVRLPRPKGETAAREQAALAANRDLADALTAAGPFDLVYERYALWSHAGMTYARASGTPSVLEVNAPLIEEQAAHRELVDRASAAWVAHTVFGTADVLAAVSREVAAYLEDFPEAVGRVHVVPTGVDAERFRPRADAPAVEAKGFTVGFVGSLKPWHGLDTLVDAFIRLHGRASESRLLIVGDGPERANVEAGLAEAGLADAVVFTGRVASADVPAYLAAMDVAVAPYPPMDACYFSPLKLYEYMAAGMPVVASRIGQIPDVVRDGESGLLCAPGDASALAAALDRLRIDPALRVRLSRAARHAVLERHTWTAVFGRVLALAGVEAGASDPIRVS